MTPDFSLIPYTPQRYPYKLPSQCLSDRFSERGLSYAGWSYKAENRAFHLFLEFSHTQILQYTLLDLLKIIMILIQHLRCSLDIQIVFCTFAPGELNHPFKVCPHRRGLSAIRVHLFKAL